MNAKTRPQSDASANLEAAVADLYDTAKNLGLASIRGFHRIAQDSGAGFASPVDTAAAFATSWARTTKDMLDFTARCHESGWRLYTQAIRAACPSPAGQAAPDSGSR